MPEPAILGEIPVAPPSPVGTTATSTRQIDEKSAVRESDADILRSAGQRRVNIIWELTQAGIAISVVGTVLFANARIALSAAELTPGASSALMQLNVTGALVIGFYFGRTNHQRVGGIGSDANSTRSVLLLPLLLMGYLPILVVGHPLVLPMLLQVVGLSLLVSHIFTLRSAR